MAEPTKVKTIGAIDIYFDGEATFYADIPDGPYRTKRKTRTTLSALVRELSKRANPIKCFEVIERYRSVDRAGWFVDRGYGAPTVDSVWIHYHDISEVTVTDFDARTKRYRDEDGDLTSFNDGPYIWDDAVIEELQRIFTEERIQTARIAWARQEASTTLRKPTIDDFHAAPEKEEASVPR